MSGLTGTPDAPRSRPASRPQRECLDAARGLHQTALTARLRAVAAVLLRRPLTWVVMAIQVVGMGWLWFHFDDRMPAYLEGATHPGQTEASMGLFQMRQEFERRQRWDAAPSAPYPQPAANYGLPSHSSPFRKEPLPEEIQTLTLWQVPDRSVLQQYPRTKFVHVVLPPTAALIDQLLSDYELEALTLTHPHRVEELSAILSRVAQETTLRELAVYGFMVFQNQQPVPWPSGLETLRLSLSEWPSAERFAEVAQLPRLRTLILNVDTRASFPPMPDALAEALVRSRSLRTVYIADAVGEPGVRALALQRQLPSLAIRPMQVPGRRVHGSLFVLLLAMATPAWGLIVLAALGVQPQGWLMAGTIAPYRLLVVLGTIVSSGLWFWVLRGWDVDPLVAVAIVTAPWTVYLVCDGLYRLTPSGRLGFANPWLTLAPAMFVWWQPLMLPLLRHAFPVGLGEWDWWLRGQQPAVFSGLLIAVNLGSAVVLFQRQRSLMRVSAEWSTSSVPLSALDLSAWQKAFRVEQGKRLDRLERSNPLVALWNRDIEATLRIGSFESRWDRIHLWWIAADFHPRSMILMFVVLTITQTGLMWLFMQRDATDFARRFVVIQATLMGSVLLLQAPFLIGQQRRKYLSREVLMPLDRSAWRTDWWLMQALPVIVAAAIQAIGLLWGWWQFPEARTWLKHLPVPALLGLVAIWRLSLLSMTLAPALAVVVSVGLLAVYVGTLLLSVWVLDPTGGNPPSLLLSICVTLLWSLLTWGLWQWTRSRWERWELGRIQPGAYWW